ncbi:DUF2637 domain-containing protein [Nocardia sp. NPDC052001]|uniref:DUF2637 domain-containing protein n=1 Tax=Nocardia sp. NPDC052001 TaxID=3154853 RepID=UPI003434FCE5
MSAINSSTVMLTVRGLAVATIIGVGLAAFRLSFVTLRELAERAGIPAGDAWLFPVIIDATTGTAAMLALLAADPAVRQWFTWVLSIGTVVSIVGNTVHAVIGPERLPVWACAMVAAVAPIALLVDIHGLILILRAGQQVPQPATETVPEAASVSEPPVVPDSILAEPRRLDPIPDSPMVSVQVAVAPPPRPLPVPAVLPVLPVAMS